MRMLGCTRWGVDGWETLRINVECVIVTLQCNGHAIAIFEPNWELAVAVPNANSGLATFFRRCDLETLVSWLLTGLHPHDHVANRHFL